MYKLGFFVFLGFLAMVLCIDSFRKSCGANRTYSDCPGSCPRTCKPGPKKCTFDCGRPRPRCVCKGGYYMSSYYGACVLEADCPKFETQSS